MRHVPIGEFKDKVSEYVAAAAAGEDVVITRHGKAMAKLVPVEDDRMARQRAAARKLYELGQEILRTRGPTTPEEIVEWVRDGRRY